MIHRLERVHSRKALDVDRKDVFQGIAAATGQVTASSREPCMDVVRRQEIYAETQDPGILGSVDIN